MNDKQKFAYVTYIATSPEKLWTALTNGDITEKYWGDERIHSTWQVGLPVKFTHKGSGDTSIQGEVIQYDPPHLLGYTFHFPGSEEVQPSRVLFNIEMLGAVVRLTLTHDELDEQNFIAISRGWPQILSSLKSLLESGQPLVYERWY